MNDNHNATFVILNTYFELRRDIENDLRPSLGVQKQLEALGEYLQSRGYDLDEIYRWKSDHYPIPINDGETEAWKTVYDKLSPFSDSEFIRGAYALYLMSLVQLQRLGVQV